MQKHISCESGWSGKGIFKLSSSKLPKHKVILLLVTGESSQLASFLSQKQWCLQRVGICNKHIVCKNPLGKAVHRGIHWQWERVHLDMNLSLIFKTLKLNKCTSFKYVQRSINSNLVELYTNQGSIKISILSYVWWEDLASLSMKIITICCRPFGWSGVSGKWKGFRQEASCRLWQPIPPVISALKIFYAKVLVTHVDLITLRALLIGVKSVRLRLDGCQLDGFEFNKCYSWVNIF